jgi:hypothetical protein
MKPIDMELLKAQFDKSIGEIKTVWRFPVAAMDADLKSIAELVKALEAGSYNSAPQYQGQELKLEGIDDAIIEKIIYRDEHLRPAKKVVCECGSAKTGVKDYAPGHSSWCPVKSHG